MNIKLICIGKTDEDYLKTGISIFEKRLQHYVNFKIVIIPSVKDSKNLSPSEVKEREAELLLKYFSKNDYIVLLDERGDSYRSTEFSRFIQNQMNTGLKSLIFVIGGAWGFSSEIYKRANTKISFSKMTFSHQMIRLFFVEQCYRAFTILKNERYHNE